MSGTRPRARKARSRRRAFRRAIGRPCAMASPHSSSCNPGSTIPRGTTPLALPDAEQTLAALVERMRGAIAFDAKFVGIYSGGAWMAERLAQAIPGDHAVGFIDVSFYRDDFSRKGLKPEVKRTELPFEVEGATIVLVDDVLYTGRSVRAAIRLQPVLREFDAHADDIRDRRQAAVGRRHQPEHRRLVDQQGGDAARHRR